MPNRRRLLTWVLLGLVVVVGVALGRTADVAAAPALPAEAATHLVDHGDDDAAPCVVRSDCAGAWTFGAAGLLLAVVVTVPAVGVAPTIRRVVAAPAALHSALLPSGLFRPPQPS